MAVAQHREGTMTKPVDRVCSIYIQIPMRMAESRPSLPEDRDVAHVTLLYVGPASKKDFWSIVEGIQKLVRKPDNVLRGVVCVVRPMLKFFDDLSLVWPAKAVAYAPAILIDDYVYIEDIGEEIHGAIYEVARRRAIVHHVNSNGQYTPHLTLRYLRRSPTAQDRRDLRAIARRVAGKFSVNVDWGNEQRVIISTTTGVIYQEGG